MKKKSAPASVEQHMRELERQLRHHQKLYYIKHAPEISDVEFDRLFAELQKLEEKHPELASPHSPTRQIGSDLSGDFPRFQHTVPVLSLSNTYSTAEALQWAQKIAREFQNVTFSVQWKIDGATLVCYYHEGQLERAVTRGSGQIGDEITANARTIADIPHHLTEIVDLVVRGEVYMHFQDFDDFNQLAGNRYANPRNLTAGSLKQKNPADVALRPLRYVAFDGYSATAAIKDDARMQEWLNRLGVSTFADQSFVECEALEEEILRRESLRFSLPYPVDGLVLKVSAYGQREELGFTAAFPRWATALKFTPDSAETEILSIDVAVGRTGRVTPRAILKPVRLAGTTVQHATLHNADYIKKLGARIGARVRVSKRGEIIPAVEEVLDPGKGKPFRFPVRCPSCQSPLVRPDQMADYFCYQIDCPEKIIAGLIFFAGRRQMDIAGLGEKIVRILYDKGLIRTIADIYRLENHRAELEAMEGFGKKSVDQLLRGIADSKKQLFSKVLYSLGLRDLGPAVSDLLIRAGLSSMDALLSLSDAPDATERLGKIHGIGPTTSQAIAQQLRDPTLRSLIAELKEVGLSLSMPPEEKKADLEAIFAGQTWCVTGSFEQFKPRDKAMELVRERGGRVVSAVTRATTHLLAGEAAGSKLEKARELGLTIVSEAEFARLLGQSARPS